MKDRPGGGRASQYCPLCRRLSVGWVWNLVAVGWWVGLAHCWVLKDQAGTLSLRVRGVWLV